MLRSPKNLRTAARFLRHMRCLLWHLDWAQSQIFDRALKSELIYAFKQELCGIQ